MEIDIKEISIMACFMDKANLFGQMVYNIKANLLIIESQEQVLINGQMEVCIKVKLKMVLDMALANIWLIKQLIKVNGFKEKNKVKEKLFLKVEVFSKAILKMIQNKDMEKCIIILQEIILKDNGKMIKNKVREQWIGQI